MSQITIQQALQQAYQYYAGGRLRELEAVCRQILGVDPQNAEALHLMGVIGQRVGNYAVSAEYLVRAIQAAPFMAILYNTYGETLRLMGQTRAAVEAFGQALARNPEMAEARSNQGIALQAMGEVGNAEAAFRAAIEMKPGLADAYSHLGCLLNSQGKSEEALAAIEQALAINPQFAAAWNNYGVVLETMGRLEEAIEAYERAATLNPMLPEAYHNMGVPLVKLNRLGEAKACWEQAVALRPAFGDAHFNLGLIYLLEGDLVRGWGEHEWRWKVAGLSVDRHFRQAQWDGRELGGKTILLHPEQGYGDSIQFMRFAPLVAARGGRVVLEVQKELVELAKSVEGVAEVVALNDPLPAFDVHAALLTVPYLLATAVETIPARVPYLRVAEEALRRWESLVREATGEGTELKVGLVWQGRPTHKDDANRSMGLDALRALMGISGVRFFSLQKYAGAAEAGRKPEGMVDLTEQIRDFSDTGALIEQLDLVIGVDTSVVHLAGALGRKVWTLLPFAPDWRWMMERMDTPWYPTMRLFRQKRRGDWEGVLREVAEALGALAGNKA